MGDLSPWKTWNDVADTVHVRPPFLIEEFIPSDGDVLLWGASSVGKTPIMWHMARAIATGTDFANHYHTIQSPVLIIELDQAEMVTTERIKHLPRLEGNPPLIVEHLDPFDTPLSQRTVERLLFLRDAVQPRAIFFDTLRKCHSLDDTASATVKIVYGQFRNLFPETARIYVHHSRKLGTEDHRPTEESFAGSQAWKNDATMGFHAEPIKGGLRLTCRKNQLGELDWSVKFRLIDGIELVSDTTTNETLRRIIETEGDPRKRVAQAREQLGFSERYARKRIREMEESVHNS